MKRMIALILSFTLIISIFVPNLCAAYLDTLAEDASSVVQEAADASSLMDRQPGTEEDQSVSDSEASASAEPDRSDSSEQQEQKEPEASGEQEAEASGEQKAEASGEQEAAKQGIKGKDFEPQRKQDPEQRQLKKTLKTVDGITYRFTVSFDEDTGIPDDAELSVVELNQALTGEEQEKEENRKRPYDTERFVSGKALEQDTYDLHQGLKVRKKDYVLFTKFLDLSLTADGKEVQPKTPVTVTLETDVVEEGASDALEAAVYDEKATEQWQKRRDKLVRKQEEQLQNGKLKEEDVQRFPERMFRPLKLTNETEKKKGTKVSFRMEKFTRLGVAGVTKRLKAWKVKGETVCVYGPRGLKAKVTKETLKTPKAGLETVRAFSVKPNEKKNPGYDVTFWVGGVPEQYESAEEDAALTTMSEEIPDTGVVACELNGSGKTGHTLIGTEGTSAPVAIPAGRSVGLLWDTGLREQSVEAENVSVEGLLPKNAQVSAEDLLWRYSRPQEVVEDVGEDAETLAAYDIAISGRQGEFQPEKEDSVSVSIQNEAISQNKRLEIWHLNDDESVEIIRDFEVKGDTISFDASGFNVYMVVQVTKERVLTASDGRQYKVTVAYDSDALIPEDAELSVSELAPEGKECRHYVKKAAKKLDRKPEQLDYAHAFDIALVNPESGEHYQPAKPLKVSICLLSEDVSQGDRLSVVHFGDKTEVLDSCVRGESVEFETDGFSVYIVAKDALMKHFVFYSPDDDGEYHSASEQVLVSGETLVKPADPTSGGAAVFQHWSRTKNGSAVEDESTFGVQVFRAEDIQGATSAEKQAWLDAHPTEFYAVFNTSRAVVTYYNQSGQIYRMLYKSIDGTLGHLPDYAPVQDKEGTAFTFGGWETDAGTAVNASTPVRGNLDLYPTLIEGHYLYFDGNSTAASAIGEQIVPNGQSADDVLSALNARNDLIPARDDYTFTGWYISTSDAHDKDTDPTTKTQPVFYPDPADAGRLAVNAAEYAKLLDATNNLPNNPTLHAHWDKATASDYTILIWAQSAGDETRYDYVKKVSASGESGKQASASFGGTDYTVSNNVWTSVSEQAAFHSKASRVERSFPTIRADGSTVVNIYFKRRTVTINFRRYGTFEEIIANTGTQYGEVDGEHYLLQGTHITARTPVDPTDLTYTDLDSYTYEVYEQETLAYNGSYYTVDENGAYSASPVSLTVVENGVWEDGDGNEYTEVYQKTGSLEVCNSQRYEKGADGSFFMTWDEGGGLYGRDSNGYYVPLTAYRWTYNDGTGEKVYTGTRYTQSASNDWRIWKQFTGLYDAPFDQWPAGYDWYTAHAADGSTAGTHAAGLDSFHTADDSDTIDFYAADLSGAAGTMFSYLEPHTLSFNLNYTGADNSSYTASVPCGASLKDSISFPSAPTREGYHFEGWFKDEACHKPLTEAEYNTLTMPNADVTYYGKWHTVRNLVRLVPNEGELPSGLSARLYLEPGASLPAPQNPTRDYVPTESGQGEYVYNAVNGCYTLAETEGQGQYTYKPGIYASDGWYLAVPESGAVKHIVEYSAGEYAYAYGSYESAGDGQGSYAKTDGVYRYVGKGNGSWNFVDAGYTISEDSYNGSTVTEPMILVARWNREGGFRVEYKVEDPAYPDADYTGVTAPADGNEYIDSSCAMVLPAVTAPDGLTLDYWYLEKTWDSAPVKYRSNDLLPINEDNADENMVVTLTAHYREYESNERDTAAFTFMVPTAASYDPDSGSYRPDDPSYETYEVQRIAKGETLISPDNPKAPDDYTFRGWYYDKAGHYPFRGFGEITNAANTILYARFEKVVTVTYYLTEVSGTSYTSGAKVLASQSYTAGDTLDTRGVTHPVDEDHYVVAWVSDHTYWTNYQNGGSIDDSYVFGYKSNTGKAVPSGSTSLYAVLARRNYVKYDSCGGSYVAPEQIPDGGIPVRPAEPTKDGFDFAGWFVSANEGSAEYRFDSVLEDFAGYTDTLYAHWTPSTSAKGSLHVIFWAQTADRPQDDAQAAADTKCYQMLYTVDLKDCVSYGSHSWDEAFLLDQLGEFADTTDPEHPVYDLVKTVKTARKDTANNGAVNAFVDDVLGYKGNDADVIQNYTAANYIDQLNKYYQFNGSKSDTDVTVDGSGNAVLNIRFDLKTFQLAFSQVWSSAERAYANIHWNDQTYPLNVVASTMYKIPVWLNREIPKNLWPVDETGKDSHSSENAYVLWSSVARPGSMLYGWEIRNQYKLSGSSATISKGNVVHRTPLSLSDKLIIDTILDFGTNGVFIVHPKSYNDASAYPATAVIHYLVRDGKYNQYEELHDLRTEIPVEDPSGDNGNYVRFTSSVCHIHNATHVTDDKRYHKTAYNAIEPVSISGYSVIDNEVAHKGDLLNPDGTQDDGLEDGKNLSYLFNLVKSRIGRAHVIEHPEDDFVYQNYFKNHLDTATQKDQFDPRQLESGSKVYNFYFYFKPNSYILKLYTDASTQIDSQDVFCGQTLSGILDQVTITPDQIPAKYRHGYEFAGWAASPYQSDENAGIAADAAMPAYNLALYAIWKPVEYSVKTIQIDVDGGEKDYIASYGQRLQELGIPNPERDGKLFLGWQKVNADGTTVDITGMYTITDDLTLRPRWNNLDTWKVTYHASASAADVVSAGTAPTDGNNYIEGAKAIVKGGNGLCVTRTDVDGIPYQARFVYWRDQDGNLYYPYDTLQSSSDVDLYAVYSSYRETVLVYDSNASGAQFVLEQDGSAYTPAYEDSGRQKVKVSYRDWIRSDFNAARDRIPNQESTIGQDHNGTAFTVKRSDAAFLGWSRSESAQAPDCYNGDRVFVNTLGQGNVLYAVWGICKVVDKNGAEHPFGTIQQAVDFINTTDLLDDKTGSVELLLDCNLSREADAVTIPAGCTVTLTTAATKTDLPQGQKLAFAPTFSSRDGRTAADSADSAILRRHCDGTSLFTVNGTLKLEAILLDGNSGSYTCTQNGGLVSVASGGALRAGSGSVLRSSSADGMGGAVYAANGASVLFSDATVTGNRSDNGGAVAVGGTGSRLFFEGNTVIYDNLGTDGNQKNVWLDQNTNAVLNTTAVGLGDDAHIGVYVSGAQNQNPYLSHGMRDKDFATYDTTAGGKGDQNPQCFTNDRHGYAGTLNPTDHLIRWQGAICKITRADTGALLYCTASEETNREAVFSDLQSAFTNLNNLYTDSACNSASRYTPNASQPVKIEMLVQAYELPTTASINATGSYCVTLTTAKKDGETGFVNDGYPYTGRTGSIAAINRGSCTKSMVQMGSSMHLTLEQITLSGKDYKIHGSGALFFLDHHSQLTLGSGATLQNGIADDMGGGVYLHNESAKLIMEEGSVIQDCEAGRNVYYAGGGVCVNAGSMEMTGGTIRRCHATSTHSGDAHSGGAGGGIAVGHHESLTMSGGEIIDCTAVKSGGAVELHGDMTMTGGSISGCSSDRGGAVNFYGGGDHTDEGRLFLSGSPRIFDNLASDNSQKNVDISRLDQSHELSSTNVLNKIQVNGPLNADAAVGVYAPSAAETKDGQSNDEEGDYFGRYSTGSQDSFCIFINDKTGYLVGEDDGSSNTSGRLRWRGVLCKIVDSHQVEHVFSTLNAALEHSRTNADDYVTDSAASNVKICTIQMLRDYRMPSTDAMTLNKTKPDRITLTTAGKKGTAPEGEKYYYSGSGDRATITRGSSNKASMFTVGNGAAFTTRNIILDGGANLDASNLTAENWPNSGLTVKVSGGIVNAAAGSALTVSAGTTMQNSCVSEQPGGAIYAAVDALTIEGDESVGAKSVLFQYCSAKGGGAVAIGDSENVVVAPAPTSLSNCTFSYCHSASNGKDDKWAGGGVRSSALEMVLTSCSFDHCSAACQGGGFYQGNKKDNNAAQQFTATNCSFEYCYAGIPGGENVRAAGAFETQAKTVTITGGHFTECASTKNAGAINVYRKDSKSDLIIREASFTNCHASTTANEGDGGAIRNNGNSTVVESCSITDCYAKRGGAVFSNSTTTISDTSVTGCWATVSGGAVYVGSKKCEMEGGTISNCYAPLGGGVYQGGGTFNFQSGSISGCVAVSTELSNGSVRFKTDSKNQQGGGVYLGEGIFNQNGGTISGCKAVGNGGGICLGGGTYSLTSGSISDCTGKAGGGLYANTSKTVTISASGEVITDCHAKDLTVSANQTTGEASVTAQADAKAGNIGGGIYQAGGTLTITKTGAVIHSCSAWQGGGIYLGGTSSQLTLSGKIGTAGKGNTAHDGGGIYQGGGTLTLNSTASLSGNQANGGSGGGIYLGGDENTSFLLSGTVGGSTARDGNTAVNGGGIFQQNGALTIDRSVSIANNSAQGGNGGGVYLGGGSLSISGGAVKSNAASAATGRDTGHGGGVYLGGGSLSISAGNIGGAIASDGNTAVNGGGIYQGGGTLTISGGNIKSNLAQSSEAGSGFGGGIYLGGGTFTLSGGEIGGLSETDNTPTGPNRARRGGGLYVEDGTESAPTNATIRGGKIAGNEATEAVSVNSVDSDGNPVVHVTDAGGAGIAIGGKNVRLYFEGSIQVWGNTITVPDTDGADTSVPCDVCLSEDSIQIIRTTKTGLNEDSHIGVFVPDTAIDIDGRATTLFEEHGKANCPFGTFDNDENLHRFINNRSGPGYRGYEYYYGTRWPEDDNVRIYWADYVCKITDQRGELLFTDKKATAPALYQYLGKRGAFEALGRNFYDISGRPTSPAMVRMLVNEYDLKWDEPVTLPENRSITLTIVSADDQDYAHHQDEWPGFATIRRGSCQSASMFATNAGSTLTLENVVVDGGAEFDESGTPTDESKLDIDGALIKSKGNVILNSGAVLRNAAITDGKSGCAVFFTQSDQSSINSFVMKSGSRIGNCKAKHGSVLGVIAGQNTVQFSMEDGAILSNCPATNGLLYVRSGTLNLISPLNGDNGSIIGSISQNGGLAYVNGGTLNVNSTLEGFKTASNGGAVYVNSGTMNLNGTISGCSAPNGGGIYTKGTLNLKGSVIGCSASSNGGGIYQNAGTLNMTEGAPSLKDCTAPLGGGIIIREGSTATFSTGEISGNTSSGGYGGGAIRIDGNNSTANATISGDVLIRNNSVDNSENEKDSYGGAINAKKANVTISGGTICDNRVEVKNRPGFGGAIHIGESSALEITGGTISCNKVIATGGNAYGGAISLKSGTAHMAISGGTICLNEAKTNNKDAFGGGIALIESAAVTMTGGTISCNTVHTDASNKKAFGAGIYTDQNCSVSLSGSPSFGGTYTVDEDGTEKTCILALDSSHTATITTTDSSGNAVTQTRTLYRRYYQKIENNSTSTVYPDQRSGNPIYYMWEDGSLYLVDRLGNKIEAVDEGYIPGVGNLSSTALTDKTNGKVPYLQAREDLFLAGYENSSAESLKVTGALSAGPGSIWVHAEHGNGHNLLSAQFALFAGGGMSLSDEAKAAAAKAFRNACDDATSQNSTDEYLCGVVDSGSASICWSGPKGTIRAILEKVGKSQEPLAGAEFELYQGQTNTRAAWPGLFDDDNQPVYVVQSTASGVFYIGELTYGEYYLKETAPPTENAYSGNKDKWFCLLVDETGVWMSSAGYLNAADAKTDANAVKSAGITGT